MNPNPDPNPNRNPDPKQVRDADLVAVLRRGRLVELGTPAELARADGWFATSSPLAGHQVSSMSSFAPIRH